MPYELRKATGEDLVALGQHSVGAAVVTRWLKGDGVVTAAGQHGASRFLAIGCGRSVVLYNLGKRSAGGVLKEKARHRSFRFNTRGVEGHVSAMCWVAAGKNLALEVPLLVVGTTLGVVMVLRRTDKLVLLHRQKLGHGAITSIAQRTRGDKFSTVEALLVLSEPNLLVTVDGDAVARLADPRLAEGSSGEDIVRSLQDLDEEDAPGDDGAAAVDTDIDTFSVLPALQKDGLPCRRQRLYPKADEEEVICGIAAVAKIRPAPLDVYNKTQPKWVLCAGKHPTLSAFDAPFEAEDVSISNLAKDAAKKTLNLLQGAFWGRGARTTESHKPHSLAKLAKPLPLEALYAFDDTERVVERIVGDAEGRYVAVADNLGRVMVVDCQLFAVVKMLKGYRDAHVVWLPPLTPAQVDAAAPCPTHANVFLVHLPRRGIVEAWAVAHPQRLAAAKIGFDCRVVQCTPRPDSSCLVVYADGTSASLELRVVDAEAEQAAPKEEVPAEAHSAQLKKWSDLCVAGASGEALAEALGGMHSALDILECVVTMPAALGAGVWREVTAAALDVLERRGIGGEDIVTQSGEGGAGAMGATGGDGAVVPERERLMGPHAPHLTEGDAYRYLVNRLSVMRVYLRLVGKPRAQQRASLKKPDDILRTWNEALEGYIAERQGAEGASPLSPSAAQLVCPSVLMPADDYEYMSVIEFLSYFDLLRGAGVVRYDAPLAEFMCHALRAASTEQFADCCYALSLPNKTVLDVLLLWGQRPRYLNAVVPLETLALLVAAPLQDYLAVKSPRWLVELTSETQLRHVAYMIFAARKRAADAEPEDSRLDLFDAWLTQLLALLELKLLLPDDGVPWMKDVSLSALALIPPAGIIAAYCVDKGVPVDDVPGAAEYMEQRAAVESFHAHTAMFLVYLYLKASRLGWEGKGAGVVDTWVQIAEDIVHRHADDADPRGLISRALCHVGKTGDHMQTTLFWCTTTLLMPLASLIDVAKHCKSTPLAACVATQRAHEDVVAHCDEVMGFLELLTKYETDIEDDPITRDWWAIGGYDAMLRTAKFSHHMTPIPKFELHTLLTFIKAALHRDFRTLPPFAAAAKMHWGRMFAGDTLRMLQPPPPHSPARTPASLPQDLQAGRAAFVAEVLRHVPDAGRIQSVGATLSKTLAVERSDFITSEVVLRMLLEGCDGQAVDILEGLGTHTEEGTLYPRAYVQLLQRVVRLRLRLALANPVAGGGSQRRQEQSLNLMSGMPLALMEWVQEGDATAFTAAEEQLAAHAFAATPSKTNYHKMKNLATVALRQARFAGDDKCVLDHLEATLAYATYLQKNVT